MLNKRITSEEQSIAFIRNKIRGFVKAHGGHAKSINDAKQDKLGKCEDDTEIRRQTFLELHTFLDSIFQHMSEGLEVLSPSSCFPSGILSPDGC